MLIRNEKAGDEDAIDALTSKAFEPMPFSQGTEAAIIRALRKSGDLIISLVAEVDGKVVGHVAFSPVAIAGDDRNWFGLGPVAVEPALQRSGIGTALIARGLDVLKTRSAAGCALIGDPNYYSRLGFASDGKLTYAGLDTRLVQRLVFYGEPPRGELVFAPAFQVSNEAG